MDFKNLIPYITALGAGGAGFYFLGMEKKGEKRKLKDGMEPWACAVGGLLVGYVAGKFVQSKLAPQPQPQLPQATAPTTEQNLAEYLELDTPVRALPPPAPLRTPQPPPPDVRAAHVSDAAILHSKGIFEGTGEESLGSYEPEEDVDNIDVAALLRESGWDGKNN